MATTISVQSAVSTVKRAGLPVYKEATREHPAIPGITVRKGWRGNTIDVFSSGGDSNAFSRLDHAVKALHRAGWVNVYTNWPGLAITMTRNNP